MIYHYYFLHTNLCMSLLQYAHALFQKTYLITLLYSINFNLQQAMAVLFKSGNEPPGSLKAN